MKRGRALPNLPRVRQHFGQFYLIRPSNLFIFAAELFYSCLKILPVRLLSPPLSLALCGKNQDRNRGQLLWLCVLISSRFFYFILLQSRGAHKGTKLWYGSLSLLLILLSFFLLCI